MDFRFRLESLLFALSLYFASSLLTSCNTKEPVASQYKKANPRGGAAEPSNESGDQDSADAEDSETEGDDSGSDEETGDSEDSDAEAFSVDTTKADAGLAFYTENCAVCHDTNGIVLLESSVGELYSPSAITAEETKTVHENVAWPDETQAEELAHAFSKNE